MFHVVLHEPRIPPNTGNVIRLCANTGSALHLVEPLGFTMDAAQLRRAGLDYQELAVVSVHPSLAAVRAALPEPDHRWFATSARGGHAPSDCALQPGDVFLFGTEPSGLPEAVLAAFPSERRLRLPMVAGNRSLNLSNAVAVTVYEAWRQQGFTGAGR
ncbi:MAG TPA: tRNA (cytidine(34)-2'-O)-methyltransferase [Candidatus Nanopelagicales bacterium]